MKVHAFDRLILDILPCAIGFLLGLKVGGLI